MSQFTSRVLGGLLFGWCNGILVALWMIMWADNPPENIGSFVEASGIFGGAVGGAACGIFGQSKKGGEEKPQDE